MNPQFSNWKNHTPWPKGRPDWKLVLAQYRGLQGCLLGCSGAVLFAAVIAVSMLHQHAWPILLIAVLLLRTELRIGCGLVRRSRYVDVARQLGGNLDFHIRIFRQGVYLGEDLGNFDLEEGILHFNGTRCSYSLANQSVDAFVMPLSSFRSAIPYSKLRLLPIAGKGSIMIVVTCLRSDQKHDVFEVFRRTASSGDSIYPPVVFGPGGSNFRLLFFLLVAETAMSASLFLFFYLITSSVWVAIGAVILFGNLPNGLPSAFDQLPNMLLLRKSLRPVAAG